VSFKSDLTVIHLDIYGVSAIKCSSSGLPYVAVIRHDFDISKVQSFNIQDKNKYSSI